MRRQSSMIDGFGRTGSPCDSRMIRPWRLPDRIKSWSEKVPRAGPRSAERMILRRRFSQADQIPDRKERLNHRNGRWRSGTRRSSIRSGAVGFATAWSIKVVRTILAREGGEVQSKRVKSTRFTHDNSVILILAWIGDFRYKPL